MMKEKKTSLNNNGNGSDSPSKSSILNEVEPQTSLSLSSVISDTHSAKKQFQNSSIVTLLEKQRSLFANSAMTSVLAAQKQFRDSSIAALLEKQRSLSPHSAMTSALAAQKQFRDGSIAALLEKQRSLFANSAMTSALAAQKQLRDGSIAALLEKQKHLFTGKLFSTNIAKYLAELNVNEVQKLEQAAILFSRSPLGAAVIATNIHSIQEKEPDALTRLKNHIEENPITSSFRKLPLLLQLIIIYLMTTIYSVGADKNKELAVYLMGQAQQYVSKAVSPSSHVKKLTKQLPSEIDTDTLKHIRIITGGNVRLRNTPSMQGDVLVTLEKYTPVIVINKSDRKWLYVQLSLGDQKLYGWVNRSYTKAISH